jgi:uncharacterized protein (TIGR02679 family)
VRPELRRILDDLPGLRLVLDRAAERYIQLSRLGGTVEVTNSELRSVGRLGCRVDQRRRVRLADLDRAFRASRLSMGLRDVLEEFRGEPLVTRTEALEKEDLAWAELTDRLSALGRPPWVGQWLEDQDSALRSEWRRHGDAWSSALETAVRAAGLLETVEEGTDLAHLAYRASGDAHGLDADRTAGRLFERLLASRATDVGFSFPLSAEDRESLLALAGLAIDEISSTVHVAGLEGSDPLVAAARSGRHVIALPLRTLYAIRSDVRAHRDVVFAVENRSLLSRLHRGLADVPAERYPTLVCTGGHVSLATLRLLEALVARGANVRYSGDFDAKGLMIADALASRLGPAFHAWRLDSGAYLEALARGGASDVVEPGPFNRGATARFPELVRLICARGAAFQEGLSEVLLEDLRRWTFGLDSGRA